MYNQTGIELSNVLSTYQQMTEAIKNVKTMVLALTYEL
jgi:hypothetical protein